MSYSIISGSGELVECNLGEKLKELYDNIYLEIDNIKDKYKEIIKGIVVDKKKYDHVLSKLISIFNSKDSEELVNVLNKLNESYSPYNHYKFFLQKFKLEELLQKSFKSLLIKHGILPSNIYEDMHLIYKLSKDAKYKRSNQLKESINKFENLLYQSNFVSPVLNEYKKNNKPYIIPKHNLKGIVELLAIIESIDKLKLIQISLFKEINELYLSSHCLINEINLFNQNC
jgi:hypothetical protein